MIKEIAEELEKYIEFAEQGASHVLAAYALLSYSYQNFDTIPYIYLSGWRETGKTRVLTAMSKLVENSILSADITGAALYRYIDAKKPLTLLDEEENLSDKKNPRSEDLRRILLSGYKNGGKAYRVAEKKKGDVKTQEVVGFETFCPKMIACITQIDQTLESRCIVYNMIRTRNKDIAAKRLPRGENGFFALRTDMSAWLAEKNEEIKQVYEDIAKSPELCGRDWELWEALLSIAKVDGEEEYLRMVEHMKRKSEERKMINAVDEVQLVLLHTLSGQVQIDGWFLTKDIKDMLLNELKKSGDEDFKWVNAAWVGRQLKRMGLTDVRRTGAGVEHYLRRERILDLVARYGVELKEEKKEDFVVGGAQEEKLGSVSIVKLEQGEFGRCCFCGTIKTLGWKVAGNLTCSECKEIEEKR